MLSRPYPLRCADAAGGAPRRTVVLDEGALQRLRSLDPGGRNQVLERVLGAYLGTLSRLLQQIGPGAAADLDGLRRAVHTLKSSSASVGALDLSRRCVEVELRLRARQLDDLEPLLEAIRAEVAGVEQAVRAMLQA